MQIIIGLGNPGSNYQHTRHNVGFMFVDALVQKYSCEWKESKKLYSQIAKPAAQDILYAKPATFMNSSGLAVKKLLNFYSLSVNNLLVVHDDLDLPLGEYKLNQKSPKDHNGIKSIEENLKSKKFNRLRLGIDNRGPNNRIPGDQYVLGRFNPQELEIIQKLIKELSNAY